MRNSTTSSAKYSVGWQSGRQFCKGGREEPNQSPERCCQRHCERRRRPVQLRRGQAWKNTDYRSGLERAIRLHLRHLDSIGGQCHVRRTARQGGFEAFREPGAKYQRGCALRSDRHLAGSRHRPGISGAISAGLTLAQGKPLDEALLAAAIGAVPGGALAKSMAQMAVAAASGKPLSDIAVSALPIPPTAKEALQAGLRVASDVAQGKRVDKSLLAEANRQIDRLPAQYRKATQIGIALGQGKKLQDVAMQQLPTLIATGGPLARAGRTIAMQSPILRQARGLNAHGQHGFDIAQGLLARGSVPVHEIKRVRGAFRGAALKGFDAAIALHRRRFASQRPTRELESFGQFEAQMPEYGEVESGEDIDSGAEDAIFGEAEEMELGAQLLEITGENELDEFLGGLIARATGGERRLASSTHLRQLLRQTAKSALPMIGDTAEKLVGSSLGGTAGARLAAAAGDLFGLELEGLSPEDQEFEVARRFVRFAGASARNTRRSRENVPPKLAAQRAADAAARRHAPGFLRRRQPRDVRGWSDNVPAPPIPIAVTCHCCGTQQTVEVPGTIGDRNSSDNTLPDNEPANSNSTASEPKPEETKMHDIDRTTMEISDEADFEFSESQEESGPEGPFSEEEEAEHAAQLLEINDEAELDQFIGSLLNLAGRAAHARGFSLANLKSQLLRPLGGFLKGAIKKALPIAGGAFGNMIAPAIGGQIGSRLASGAGDLLGFEYEALAPEDQEFEVAKRMVRMVGDAVQNAAQAAPPVDPKAAAKSAVIAAAQTHVPGLLQAQPQPAAPGHHHRPRSGKWYRRGHKILLIGV